MRRRYSAVGTGTATVAGSAARVLTVFAGRASLAHSRVTVSHHALGSSTGRAKGAGPRGGVPVATGRAVAGTKPLDVCGGIACGCTGVITPAFAVKGVLRGISTAAVTSIRRTPPFGLPH